jgi:hypothetical protein
MAANTDNEAMFMRVCLVVGMKKKVHYDHEENKERVLRATKTVVVEGEEGQEGTVNELRHVGFLFW